MYIDHGTYSEYIALCVQWIIHVIITAEIAVDHKYTYVHNYVKYIDHGTYSEYITLCVQEEIYVKCYAIQYII